MSEIVLDVQNISAGYGNVSVLRGVSLTVKTGEIVSIVGCNGAGKTTLLNTISRFLPLGAGSIYFGEMCLNERAPYDLISLGIAHVPEGRKVFPRMSVLENLELGAYAFEIDRQDLKQRCEEIFELFPILRSRSVQAAGTLSGGEQQMLAIGRGLMSKPKLLLLDEPSMGIAPQLVEKIFETIVALNKSGISILLVEQDAAAALTISQRGYVLDTGEVSMTDEAKTILNNPEIVKAYLGG